MNRTNININSVDHTFKYIIEYDDIIYSSTNPIKYMKDNDRVELRWDADNIWLRNYNDWIKVELNNEFSISSYKLSNIKLYFPHFSVDTYSKTDYALTINTWINGVYVYLGTYIINRIDALACNKSVRFDSVDYYEYVTFNIINPWDIAYSDNWKLFRNEICGEPLFGDDENINNTGAQLNFTLYPVQWVNDKYIMKDGYSGGQNSINISTNRRDYLNTFINTGFNEEGICINCEINFNESYEGSINEYLKETYNINGCEYIYELVCNTYIDDNDIISIQKPINNTNIVFNRNELKQLSIFNEWPVDNTGSFVEGLFLKGSFIVKKDDKELLYIMSNEIPLTQEIFKYIIGDNNIINLDNIKMNHLNITAINKITNEVVQLDNINNSKSNIVQPVFVRVRDMQDIIIHPQVTENICINLDPYKATVNNFIIKLEDQHFNQVGSTRQGIIFKIIGSMLPNKATSGIYYILNENYELVTTGKYTYVQ